MKRSPQATLRAETASDLMTRTPVSICDAATVQEAIALLIDKGFSAAPVVDETGRPVGVVSRTDILMHDRETAFYQDSARQYYDPPGTGALARQALPNLSQSKHAGPTRVRDIMTPVVYSVAPETPVNRVIDEMLRLNVHRLFVVECTGILVGVISALDVLRHLRS